MKIFIIFLLINISVFQVEAKTHYITFSYEFRDYNRMARSEIIGVTPENQEYAREFSIHFKAIYNNFTSDNRFHDAIKSYIDDRTGNQYVVLKTDREWEIIRAYSIRNNSFENVILTWTNRDGRFDVPQDEGIYRENTRNDYIEIQKGVIPFWVNHMVVLLNGGKTVGGWSATQQAMGFTEKDGYRSFTIEYRLYYWD